MSVTAQTGQFGIALNASGATRGNPPAAASWKRFRAMNVAAAPNVPTAMAPVEIGGPNVPTGAYKTNTWFGGRVSMAPRLFGDFGDILMAATGACTTVLGGAPPVLNTHTFTFAANPAFIPFSGVRRTIPNAAGVALGEQGNDCVLNALTFNFPQAGPITGDIDVTGLDWELEDDIATNWTGWDALLTEPFDTVPLTMAGGGITLPNWAADPDPGNPLPITGARVTIMNNTTSPQEEFIIGSYYPDDYATRQRVFLVEMTYKWRSPELYRLLINGNATGATLNTFVPCPAYTDFELSVQVPCENPTAPGEYEILTFRAPKMIWQMAQPVALAGDELIMLAVTGQAVEPASGNYFEIDVVNQQTEYILPA